MIDVHHHIVPPFYLAENRDRIVAAGGGRMNPAYLSGTPEQALAAMDKNGEATAVLSLSGSAFWSGDREAGARTATESTNMPPIWYELTQVASACLP
jgi:hypothetical protein